MDKDKIKQGVQLIIEGIVKMRQGKVLLRHLTELPECTRRFLPVSMKTHLCTLVKLFQPRIRI